jgi:hypothetical protein
VTVGAGSQITDLTLSDHACLTFGEPEELFDLTAAFVRDGLSGGLKVVWLSDAGPDQVTAEPARRGIEVERAMAAGQLAAESGACLLSDQTFSAGHAVGWLIGQTAACRREGFPGLRVAVDTYHADATLRICRQYAPPGIRLAGRSTTGTPNRWLSRWRRRSASTATSRSP